MKRHFFLSGSIGLALLIVGGCKSTPAPPPAGAERNAVPTRVAPALGHIERLDPALDALVPPDAVIEKLAEGFDWSEGPLWVSAGGYLLFSDVPRNVVLKWQEDSGVSEFLKPSGYTGTTPRGGESGSNGLTLDPQGRLVLCQHGDRRVARLESGGHFHTLASSYRYRRFNSPNDLAFKSNGDLYFTDPPYGLEGQNDSPKKELMFNGVFRVARGGEVTLLTDELTFPNGLAFSPDESTLYVAVSDPQRPVIMAYGVKPDGTLAKGQVFFDAGPLAREKDRKGLPDGMKVDRAGNLFATGPGGVLVISPQGKLLGILNTGEATANCAWGNDGSVLYITADMYLCRVRTGTRGRMP
jgi:gluconolactonase